MSDAITHRAFLGQAERDFVLTAAMVLELERVTGTGIGSIIKRVIARDYGATEITETIRLALIGGGTGADEADALLRAFIHPRPMAEAYDLALSILEARVLGKSSEGNGSPVQEFAEGGDE
jgi:hypothetical protein